MVREYFNEAPDLRKGKNTQYSVSDALLSGFAVFFTKSGSFNNFEKTFAVKNSTASLNIKNLLKINKITSANTTRNILDGLAPVTDTLFCPKFDTRSCLISAQNSVQIVVPNYLKISKSSREKMPSNDI
jgi:hypothetical protein